MVIYRRTSLLESTSQTLVNTVNCVGIMGKGLAKSFKERDPRMFKAYKSICDRNLLQLGKLWLWQGEEHWILNFPTKKHWRHPSKLEWIEAGLAKFVSQYKDRGITDISFPRLGCGNGNLDWNDVKPLMEQYLGDIDIPVYIHDYEINIGIPEHSEQISRLLRAEGVLMTTFIDFLSALKRASELATENLVELKTGFPFRAHMDTNWNLSLHTSTGTRILEKDDLRGIWLSLHNGLLTTAQAGWTRIEHGNAMLSLISILPKTRVIEIEGSSGKPELAIELLTSATPTPIVSERGDQSQLAWA